jgi:hypothetical protein
MYDANYGSLHVRRRWRGSNSPQGLCVEASRSYLFRHIFVQVIRTLFHNAHKHPHLQSQSCETAARSGCGERYINADENIPFSSDGY